MQDWDAAAVRWVGSDDHALARTSAAGLGPSLRGPASVAQPIMASTATAKVCESWLNMAGVALRAVRNPIAAALGVFCSHPQPFVPHHLCHAAHPP